MHSLGSLNPFLKPNNLLKVSLSFSSLHLTSSHKVVPQNERSTHRGWSKLKQLINCFCGMVDQRKAFNHISSRNHCQRSSPSRISDTSQTGFEPAQYLSSGFVGFWGTAPQNFNIKCISMPEIPVLIPFYKSRRVQIFKRFLINLNRKNGFDATKVSIVSNLKWMEEPEKLMKHLIEWKKFLSPYFQYFQQ